MFGVPVLLVLWRMVGDDGVSEGGEVGWPVVVSIFGYFFIWGVCVCLCRIIYTYVFIILLLLGCGVKINNKLEM